MIIIGIIFTSTLIASVIAGAFYLGYKEGIKRTIVEDPNAMKVDQVETLEAINSWLDYGGK